MNEIHPLVLATIENERARRELELERLRSARASCVTVTAGGQSRALALGKRVRELERITASWRLVLATVLGEMTEAAESATEAFRELSAAVADDKDRVVGSKSPVKGTLRCVSCTAKRREEFDTGRLVDVTSKDLPDGGMCALCDADVLA